MVNQTYVDDKAYEWEGYYVREIMPTPQRVGGRLCLLIGIRTLPLSRSRHNIPPNFLEGNS
jgi:hypothetical protein